MGDHVDIVRKTSTAPTCEDSAETAALVALHFTKLRARLENQWFDSAWVIEEEEQNTFEQTFYPDQWRAKMSKKFADERAISLPATERNARRSLERTLEKEATTHQEIILRAMKINFPWSVPGYAEWRLLDLEREEAAARQDLAQVYDDGDFLRALFMDAFFPDIVSLVNEEKKERAALEQLQSRTFTAELLVPKARNVTYADKYNTLLLFLSQPGAPRLDVETPDYILNYLRKLSELDREILRDTTATAPATAPTAGEVKTIESTNDTNDGAKQQLSKKKQKQVWDCAVCSQYVSDRKGHVRHPVHVAARARMLVERKAGLGTAAGTGQKTLLTNFFLRQVLPFELTHQVLAFNMEKPPVLFFRYFDSKHRPCGHLWCSLTEKRNCCACLDKRSETEATQIYVDGEGYRTTDCRQLHYCPGCRSNHKLWKHQREEEKTGDRGAAVLNLLLDAAKR